jgi:hypothetical protein
MNDDMMRQTVLRSLASCLVVADSILELNRVD